MKILKLYVLFPKDVLETIKTLTGFSLFAVELLTVHENIVSAYVLCADCLSCESLAEYVYANVRCESTDATDSTDKFFYCE